MATRLRKLTFNEVSLVDRGANPGAHVLLFKRDETPAGNGGGDQTAGSPPAVSISGAAGDGKSGESTMTAEEVKAL
jgi:hypothetical protein